jgi:hypothetical protein
VKVDIITDRRRLDAMAQEWNGLLAESAAEFIFLTREWISLWLPYTAGWPGECQRFHALRREAGPIVPEEPVALATVRLPAARRQYLQCLPLRPMMSLCPLCRCCRRPPCRREGVPWE